MGDVAKINFTDYDSTVAAALDLIGAADRLPDDRLIIIKPNLTNADGPPVTTPVAAAELSISIARLTAAPKSPSARAAEAGRRKTASIPTATRTWPSDTGCS